MKKRTTKLTGQDKLRKFWLDQADNYNRIARMTTYKENVAYWQEKAREARKKV